MPLFWCILVCYVSLYSEREMIQSQLIINGGQVWNSLYFSRLLQSVPRLLRLNNFKYVLEESYNGSLLL